MYTYNLILQINSPTENAPEKLSEKRIEIEQAIEKFNKHFRGKKSIQNCEINKHIELELVSELPINNPTREIVKLSRILKYDFDWKDFTYSPQRMFDAQLVDHTANKGYPNKEQLESSNFTNNFSAIANLILQCDDTESLANYINKLNKLITMAESKKIVIENNKHFS